MAFFTFVTIMATSLTFTASALSCASHSSSGLNASQRSQLVLMTNLTHQVCDGVPSFENAASTFIETGNATQILSLICAYDTPHSVCGQYFGLWLWSFGNCRVKDSDPEYLLADLIMRCKNGDTTPLPQLRQLVTSGDATFLGCAWAGMIGVDVGGACNSGANAAAYRLGHGMHNLFPRHEVNDTNINNIAEPEDKKIFSDEGSMKYISCGSDDEGEGARCCMARVVSGNAWCIDWESTDPSKECLPSLCGSATPGDDRYETQIGCLDVFLDIEPRAHGYCQEVGLEDCRALAKRHPDICMIPK